MPAPPARSLPAALLVALLPLALAIGLAAPDATSAPVAEPALHWPGTEAARHAQAWFTAYNQSEPAMRALYAEHYSPPALARRPIEERIAGYRQMRDDFGPLTPVAIPEMNEDGVRVVARTADGRRLALEFECEAESPHRIHGIRVMPADGEEAVPAGPPLDDAAAVAAMKQLLDRAAQADSFSGAVLLARDGKPLLRQAWGHAERRFAVPNRAETGFNLGSVNKLFTKVAIAQLAEQGRLRLDDPLTKWLPDWPGPSAAKITVAMLVGHRAGIPDFFGPRYDAADRSRLRHNRDFVALFRDQPLWFEPGTAQRYSNGSYVLLGEIIARASGQDYYDYVREHVWTPAGMKATAYPEGDDPAAEVAMGYTRGEAGGDPLRENVFSRPARGSAAGGGYSTVDDLLRFDQALLANRLCAPGWTTWVIGGPAPADTRAAAAPGVPPEGASFGFAGGAPGISAEFDHEGPFTLILLGNFDPPYTQAMAAKLRGVMGRMKR